MKAAVLTANKKINIENLVLDSLKSTHCRVKIKNVGICSSDIQRGYGDGAYFYPLVMGHEISGEITEVGAEISEFKIGDRVAVFPLLPCFKCKSCTRNTYTQCQNYSYYGSRQHGGYAEYLDVYTWNLLKIPDEVSFHLFLFQQILFFYLLLYQLQFR